MEMASQSRQPGSDIKKYLLSSTGVLFLAAVLFWWRSQGTSQTILFEPPVRVAQSEPLCPWRQPEEDMNRFFSGSTSYQTETRILSGLRAPLAAQLGREPTGDENALRLYRVYAQQKPLGVVLTRRVKGAYGAIELVLPVAPDGHVLGLRLQRQREPGDIAAALQRPEWLASFVGKRVHDEWKLGEDVGGISEEARGSAEAIVEGTRSLLVLLSVSEGAKISTTGHH
jgi:hypothetical protein